MNATICDNIYRRLVEIKNSIDDQFAVDMAALNDPHSRSAVAKSMHKWQNKYDELWKEALHLAKQYEEHQKQTNEIDNRIGVLLVKMGL